MASLPLSCSTMCGCSKFETRRKVSRKRKPLENEEEAAIDRESRCARSTPWHFCVERQGAKRAFFDEPACNGRLLAISCVSCSQQTLALPPYRRSFPSFSRKFCCFSAVQGGLVKTVDMAGTDKGKRMSERALGCL